MIFDKQHLALAVGLVLSVGTISGCSQAPQGPPTYELTGTVTLDGSPLEEADVVFSPVAGSNGKAAQAITEANGRFEVSTHVGGGKYRLGMHSGSYHVTISKLEPMGQRASMGAPPKNLLPKEYDDSFSPVWTIEVGTEQKQVEFDLQSNRA